MGSPAIDSMVVGIVGAGTMGSGIAQVVAQAGYRVVLVDRNQTDLDRGVATIESGLKRQVDKARIQADEMARIIGSIRTSTRVVDLRTAAIVIEAIFEQFEAKRNLFGQVADAVSEEALIASNTSSISITALAASVTNPGRFVGLHFFNPVPVLPLVEVIAGYETTEATIERAMAFAASIGKSPVLVQDSPGFAVNRMLVPMINEAIFALSEGIATRDAIDEVMKLGANHPIGPLKLADLIGLDVCLAIMEVLQRDFGDDKYRPAPLLRKMVAAGKLGRKAGQGFYVYPKEA